MMSMWYAWANYTQIGYVRQSDRKMVNLGRITGEMSDWDGETGFTSYGQLTIEQAVWFKGQTRADYRAFYPGPPSNPADEYGRYIGSMISSSKFIVVDHIRGKEDLGRQHMEQLIEQQQEHIVIQDH
jgi:hypothetical protein